jgi:hypothetical protein
MVKRKKDEEPADKAAERLKQLLEARGLVPEVGPEKKKPAEEEPKKPAGPEKTQEAADEPKCP